jgi:hypothetical protein
MPRGACACGLLLRDRSPPRPGCVFDTPLQLNDPSQDQARPWRARCCCCCCRCCCCCCATRRPPNIYPHCTVCNPWRLPGGTGEERKSPIQVNLMRLFCYVRVSVRRLWEAYLKCWRGPRRQTGWVRRLLRVGAEARALRAAQQSPPHAPTTGPRRCRRPPGARPARAGQHALWHSGCGRVKRASSDAARCREGGPGGGLQNRRPRAWEEEDPAHTKQRGAAGPAGLARGLPGCLGPRLSGQGGPVTNGHRPTATQGLLPEGRRREQGGGRPVVCVGVSDADPERAAAAAGRSR